MARKSNKVRVQARPKPKAASHKAQKTKESSGDERRRFNRQSARVKVGLELAGRLDGMSFEAVLPSRDVSLGGVFLESEFFLALGTPMRVSFTLPDAPEPIVVEGVVTREERYPGRSGFAIRFTEMDARARQSLASHFLSPVVREFVKRYRQHLGSRKMVNELAQAVDLVVAWELDRLDEGRGSSL